MLVSVSLDYFTLEKCENQGQSHPVCQYKALIKLTAVCKYKLNTSSEKKN